MTMTQNPAGLAFLPGHVALVGLDAPFQKMCVDPYGYYGWGVYKRRRHVSVRRPDEGDRSPAPDPRLELLHDAARSGLQLRAEHAASAAGVAGRISKHFAPRVRLRGAGARAGHAIRRRGTVPCKHRTGPRPTPTRYSLVKQDVIYAAAPDLRRGVTGSSPSLRRAFSLQIVSIAVRSSLVQSATGGTQPSTDMLSTLTTQDLFVPALTFSVHARPVRWVNLMGAFKWSDDFSAGRPTVVYETNTYYPRPRALANVPFKNKPIHIGDVDVPLPWELSAGGAFFRACLSGAKDQEGDPMATERWDVEVDFAYTLSQPGEPEHGEPRATDGLAGHARREWDERRAHRRERRGRALGALGPAPEGLLRPACRRQLLRPAQASRGELRCFLRVAGRRLGLRGHHHVRVPARRAGGRG